MCVHYICKNEIDQRNTKIMGKVFAVLCSQSYCQISLFLFLHGRADRMQLRQEPCVQCELRAGTSFGTELSGMPRHNCLCGERNQSWWHWVYKWPAEWLLSPYVCNWLGQFKRILVCAFPQSFFLGVFMDTVITYRNKNLCLHFMYISKCVVWGIWSSMCLSQS